jgi:hypothetical protein
MYNLNKESKTAKFYEWVWDTDVTKFKTMCPYTWSYIFTILFIVPILLIKFLVYLFNKSTQSLNISADNINPPQFFVNTYEYFERQDKLWYYSGKVVKWLFVIMASIIILINVSMIIYEWYKYPIEGFAIFGIIILFLSIVFLIVYMSVKTPLLDYIAMPFKFIGRTISDLYHNVCPLIKWENKTNDK